jgi:LPXTG-motif cell wall-anchored protein
VSGGGFDAPVERWLLATGVLFVISGGVLLVRRRRR